MKRIVISLTLLLLIQVSALAETDYGKIVTDSVNGSVITFRKTRTVKCQDYSQERKGEYSAEAIYNYCCARQMIEFDKPFNPAKPQRVKEILNDVQQAERECGKTSNKCLTSKLKDIQYSCNALFTGERLEWVD